MIDLEFDRGTLLLDGPPEEIDALGLPDLLRDDRVDRWRAPAHRYRQIVLAAAGKALRDRARAYEELALESRLERTPFAHQSEAVAAWSAAGGRGLVVLPTGSGKTHVATLVIERVARSTLVVVPTIDLMAQWSGVLGTIFDVPIGLVGGGANDPQPLTVTTYDSAWIHMDRLGDRFGLLVFDECHHLPGPSYRMAAEASIAPYRLGLTATLERADGAEVELAERVGPVVYRREIQDLAGAVLSDYETIRLRVDLAPLERATYESERGIYLEFLRDQSISLGGRHGWRRFLAATNRSPAGRRALLAYRNQKRIAEASPAKLRVLRRLLVQHADETVLVFTSDNETVYRIARTFLIPAITHQTGVRERREILDRFRSGAYPFVVTSRVLNEGVDVPEASVAIVLSGSGSVREHVQRLGRILRRRDGKRATLYEIVASRTAEEGTSDRRRRHGAYE